MGIATPAGQRQCANSRAAPTSAPVRAPQGHSRHFWRVRAMSAFPLIAKGRQRATTKDGELLRLGGDDFHLDEDIWPDELRNDQQH